MATSAEVRSSLVDALQLDLIGPLVDATEHAAHREEMLPRRPSVRCLTGFLSPNDALESHRADDSNQETTEEAVGGHEDDKRVDTAAARRAFFSASMGLVACSPNCAKLEGLTSPPAALPSAGCQASSGA